MPARHQLRIASQIKYALGELIRREIKDPRIGFVTILHVEVSRDLCEAKVSLSVLGSPGDRSKTLHGLEAARGFLQREVGRFLKVRTTPQLRFILDETQDKQARIDALLDEALGRSRSEE